MEKNMEFVSIQLPASLYTALFHRFGDDTTSTISAWLTQSLLNSRAGNDRPQIQAPKYPRPGEGTITGRIWQIADQLAIETGKAEREDVIKACMKEGINPNTANTQYTHWRNANS
jgi:hypothetical protein